MRRDPKSREAEAMLILRPRNEDPDPTDGKIVVAANAGTPSNVSHKALEGWWAECCSRLSRPQVDLFKAGGVMWDHVKIDVPTEWIAFMMSLKSVDPHMARATMAALFSAVTTTVGPVDIGSLMHAITTFVHAHPAFAEITVDAEWRLPYGEGTEYCVSQPGKPDPDKT
jgi:hypothetical protein